MKPIVAIVGRPNVGKSSLFNQIIGKRVSIVHETPGVTRDRIYADAQWQERQFTLVDTGGIEIDSTEDLSVLMLKQTNIAIETADVILFVVDVKDGITNVDERISQILRKSDKKIILVVNKVDTPELEIDTYEFYNLGLGDPISISSSHKRGLGDLLDEVVSSFEDEEDDAAEKDGVISIAILGRPNAGKSSFVNALLGDERTIVSNIPGTTRDAIDTPFRYAGQDFLLIDTAGIRRKSRVSEDLEYYSVLRSISSIERADVGVIIIDGSDGVAEQDAKIAGLVHEAGKPCVLVWNKWDLVEKDSQTVEKYKKDLYDKLSFMTYAPFLTISAKTGQRITKVLDFAKEVYAQTSKRVTTGVFNDALREAVTMTEPPSKNGRQLKIYYGSQVSVCPPTFMLSVNDTDLFHFSYERYLINYFRQTFNLEMTPIRVIKQSRKQKEKD